MELEYNTMFRRRSEMKSEARRIAEEALRDGDVNNFENEGKTFFEWALMQ